MALRRPYLLPQEKVGIIEKTSFSLMQLFSETATKKHQVNPLNKNAAFKAPSKTRQNAFHD
jgi:hypothetical protein